MEELSSSSCGVQECFANLPDPPAKWGKRYLPRSGEAPPLSVLLGDGTLSTTATALTDVVALVLPRDALQALCPEHPVIGRELFRFIAEVLKGRYRATLSRLTQQLEISGPGL